MTSRRTPLTAALAAAAIATAALFGATAGAGTGAAPADRFALVIDASLARDGRELVDARLADADAEVRLPRTADEARTNVRYFDKLGYTVVVAGGDATAAAEGIGEPAVYTGGLDGALAAVR